MKSIRWGVQSFLSVMILIALTAFGLTASSEAQTAPPAQTSAQSTSSAQSAAPAQPASFCGTQPLCYEASDFAATVTDFRTSVQGGYRIIDTVIRFQNKTPNPVILGYVANSGTAMDDRGNRYIVYGANGFRGIGQVYGNNFDPRFSLSPGGYGDAQFELMWAPGQQIYGFTFELNMSVDEINTVEGNQHTLGGEFPLIFKGLANGVSSSGASGGGSSGVAMTAVSPSGGGASGQAGASAGQAAQPGCSTSGVAGTATAIAGATNSSKAQNAASNTTNTVSNAANAISNLGSIFGHKKKPAAAAPSTAGAAPCAPASPAGATSASSAASTSSTATQTMNKGASPAATSPATTAPAGVTNVSASTTTAPAQAPATAKKPATTTKKPTTDPKKTTPTTPTTPNKPS